MIKLVVEGETCGEFGGFKFTLPHGEIEYKYLDTEIESIQDTPEGVVIVWKPTFKLRVKPV